MCHYDNKFLTKIVCIDLFVHIFDYVWHVFKWQVFCLWISIYVLIYTFHCIEFVLSLFMSLCFFCILSWIIFIGFVMTFNIHQVFGVSLEEQSICVISFYFIEFILFSYWFDHFLSFLHFWVSKTQPNY